MYYAKKLFSIFALVMIALVLATTGCKKEAKTGEGETIKKGDATEATTPVEKKKTKKAVGEVEAGS